MSAIERSTELQTDRRPSVSSLEESKVAEGTLKKKKKKKRREKKTRQTWFGHGPDRQDIVCGVARLARHDMSKAGRKERRTKIVQFQ